MYETICHCTKLRRAARLVTQLYDATLAPAGLKVTQFSLLRVLSRLGAVSISRIAHETGLDRSTLGRNLRVMEADGTVRFEAGEDSREKLVRVSTKGTRVLETAIPLWTTAQERFGDLLGNNGPRLFKLADQVEKRLA
jgi:DNA-binding MarR family transcriptional regulator